LPSAVSGSNLLSVNRSYKIIVVITILAAAAWFAWGILRDKQLARDFDKVKTGASEYEVVKTIGKPKKIEKCGEFLGPLSNTDLKDCAKEYLYASPFAPLVPQYYVVRFDAHSRVWETVALSSP